MTYAALLLTPSRGNDTEAVCYLPNTDGSCSPS